MLRIPKRVNYRKQAKRGHPKAFASPSLQYGDVGRYAAAYARITARQIEAARRVIRFRMSRQGKLWIPRFPHQPVTAKPTEVRMGGGSGSVKYWGQIIKPGTIRFELRGVEANLAASACRSASKKLGFSTRILRRESLISSRS